MMLRQEKTPFSYRQRARRSYHFHTTTNCVSMSLQIIKVRFSMDCKDFPNGVIEIFQEGRTRTKKSYRTSCSNKVNWKKARFQDENYPVMPDKTISWNWITVFLLTERQGTWADDPRSTCQRNSERVKLAWKNVSKERKPEDIDFGAKDPVRSQMCEWGVERMCNAWHSEKCEY